MTTVGEIMGKAPNWLKEDAEKFGRMIPLTDSGYIELVGTEFVKFFSRFENMEGETNEWKWHVRRVDELINLTIWSLSKKNDQKGREA